MTGEGNGKLGRYRVDYSKKVGALIRELYRRAVISGIGSDFKAALKGIDHRFRSDPLGFGEITQALPAAGVVVHVGSIHPLTVRFAIHEDEKVVFPLNYSLGTP